MRFLRLSPVYSHRLSITNPDTFIDTSFDHIKSHTVYGAAILKHCIKGGTLKVPNTRADPSTFMSSSDAAEGSITLGTKPLGANLKGRLLFKEGAFSYQDEVCYRLLHEVVHGLLYSLRDHPVTDPLVNTAVGARNITDGKNGFSALGSLDYYNVDKKAREDAVELVAMYAWSPGYSDAFFEFLADPRQVDTRRQLGLISITNTTRDNMANMVSDIINIVA